MSNSTFYKENILSSKKEKVHPLVQLKLLMTVLKCV